MDVVQGMGQGAAILDAAAAGGRRLQNDAAQAAAMEQRSRSFPSDARQRLNSLQAQQSSQLSGHKVRAMTWLVCWAGASETH